MSVVGGNEDMGRGELSTNKVVSTCSHVVPTAYY